MEHASERTAIVDILNTLRNQRILSISFHGNISIRLEDKETILLAGSTLAEPSPTDPAVVDLSGEIISGDMQGSSKEIIRMHTQVYAQREDIGCVIHTHSPFATTYAVAAQPLPLVAESLARLGGAAPVPLARWAPRGSDDAVNNIIRAMASTEEVWSVLLENHGFLGWDVSPDAALSRTIAVEENAQLAYYAQALGGAQELGKGTAEDAKQRRLEYGSSL